MGRKETLILKENNITRDTKSVRARIITNITFVRKAITHKGIFHRLSRKFVKFMKRQMNKTNTSKSVQIKIGRM